MKKVRPLFTLKKLKNDSMRLIGYLQKIKYNKKKIIHVVNDFLFLYNR